MDAYEGWANDPFGTHEVRYFVDGRPTKLVRDGSVESFDDLPPKSTWPVPPTAVEPEARALWLEPSSEPTPELILEPTTEPNLEPTPEPIIAVTPEPTPEPIPQPIPERILEPAASLASEPEPAPDPPPPPPGASYWAPPPPPSALPPPAPGVVAGNGPAGSGEVVASPGVGPGGLPPRGLRPFETFVVGPTNAPRRRPRRRVVTALVVLVLAAAAGALVPEVGGGKSAEAAVIDSVNTTMADQTAHVTLNLAVSGPSVHVTGSGTGGIDFGQNAMQLQMTVGVSGQEVQMQAVYVAGSIYEQIPGVGQLIPGKSWVSLDLSSLGASGGQSSSALGSGDNPTAMLRLLTQQGNTVVPLGPSTIGGTPVQGYSVTLDAAAIKAQLAHASLPSWMATAVSQLNVQNTTLMVYIDGSGLLRRFRLDLTETVATTGKVTVDESLDLSDYGAPVNITAPPPDQVASFNQFLQDAEASGAGSAT